MTSIINTGVAGITNFFGSQILHKADLLSRCDVADEYQKIIWPAGDISLPVFLNDLEIVKSIEKALEVALDGLRTHIIFSYNDAQGLSVDSPRLSQLVDLPSHVSCSDIEASCFGSMLAITALASQIESGEIDRGIYLTVSDRARYLAPKTSWYYVNYGDVVSSCVIEPATGSLIRLLGLENKVEYLSKHDPATPPRDRLIIGGKFAEDEERIASQLLSRRSILSDGAQRGIALPIMPHKARSIISEKLSPQELLVRTERYRDVIFSGCQWLVDCEDAFNSRAFHNFVSISLGWSYTWAGLELGLPTHQSRQNSKQI